MYLRGKLPPEEQEVGEASTGVDSGESNLERTDEYPVST